MDFEAVRATLNLLTEVERDLGQAVKRSGQWYMWRCPFHADDDPSFGVKGDSFYCFGCEKSGDVTDWLRDFRSLTIEQIAQQSRQDDTDLRLRRLEYQQRQQARQLEEQNRRLSALEKITSCTDHIRYHRTMPDEGWQYWYEAGLWPETVEYYKLGYCPRCPTDHQGRASYTIPVLSNGKLWNIRHRLVNAEDGDKYRPHLAGLPNVLFNADNLRADSDSILIVEGEKKSIVTAQAGFVNVGVMGKTGFDKAWVARFADFRRVNVCYDPDGTDKAAEVAGLFVGRGRVVELPGKIDDLITLYGATTDDIRAFVEQGKPV